VYYRTLEGAAWQPVQFPTEFGLDDDMGYEGAASWRAQRSRSEAYSTSTSWTRTHTKSLDGKVSIRESERTTARALGTVRFCSDAQVPPTPQREGAPTHTEREFSQSTFGSFTASRRVSQHGLIWSRVSGQPYVWPPEDLPVVEPCHPERSTQRTFSPVAKSPFDRRGGSRYNRVNSFGLQLASPRSLADPIIPIVRLSIKTIFYIAAFIALTSIVVSSYGLTAWDHFMHRASWMGDAAGQARKRIENGVQWGRETAETIASTAGDAMETVRMAGMAAVAMNESEETRQARPHHQDRLHANHDKGKLVESHRRIYAWLWGLFPVALSKFSGFAESDECESEANIKLGSRALPDHASSDAMSKTRSSSSSSASPSSSSSEPTPSPGTSDNYQHPPRPPIHFLLASIILAIVFSFSRVPNGFLQRATESGWGRLWIFSAKVKVRTR
jgi:hypothetical protein